MAFALNSTARPSPHAQPRIDQATPAGSLICHASWSSTASRAATAARARAFARPRDHVLREMPKASHGLCAGLRGPMPCARRQRMERARGALFGPEMQLFGPIITIAPFGERRAARAHRRHSCPAFCAGTGKIFPLFFNAALYPA